MGVSGKHVSLLIDALEKGGYVHRAAHPNDRCAVLVELIESANTIMVTMAREHGELAAALVSEIPSDEVATVERGIATIAATLQKLVDHAATEVERLQS